MKMSGLFLAVFFVFSCDGYAETDSPGKLAIPAAQTQHKPTKLKSEGAKYEAYEIDGFTSASKLAAQRSHTVSGKDERNFAIFTGLVVIFIIIFLSKIQFLDKE